MLVNDKTNPIVRCPQGEGVPEYLLLSDTLYLCPPGECDIYPLWEPGEHEAVCINGWGCSEPLPVPELHPDVGLIIFLICGFLLLFLSGRRR